MSEVEPNPRLDALGNMTQEFEQSNPSPEQAQAQATAQTAEAASADGARDWGMVAFTVGGLFCMAAPELHQVYTEERCLAWGQHMQQVSDKYGWGSPSNSPEWGLAAVTFSFALPTFMVLRQKLQEAKAAKKSVMGGLFWWWKNRKKADPKAPEQAPTDQAHGVE